MADLEFNDEGVATYGEPEREIYNPNKNTVEELCGKAVCGCDQSTIQQEEPRG